MVCGVSTKNYPIRSQNNYYFSSYFSFQIYKNKYSIIKVQNKKNIVKSTGMSLSSLLYLEILNDSIFDRIYIKET